MHLSPVGSGLTIDDTLDLYCGDGEQILQWIGYTACSRLAYKRGKLYAQVLSLLICASNKLHTSHWHGIHAVAQCMVMQCSNVPMCIRIDPPYNYCISGEVYGRYVPQSITNKDGQPQDIDIVVNEIFNDNDEVFVEYSNGPMAYRVR